MNPNVDLPGMEAYRSSQANLSPSVLVIAFDPFLPLVRIPVPVGRDEDSSKGPYVLAFRNEETWRQAWKTCKEKIATQCEAGAKVGCSVSAAMACRQPWWKSYLPFSGSVPGAPIEIRFSGRPKVSTHDEVPSLATSPGNSEPANLDQKSFRLPRTTFRARELMQHEHRVDFRKRIAYWTSPKHSREGTLGSSPKEGRVGGLVHPASRDGPLQPEMENPASKGPIYIASEWLQELQRSVMKKLSS
uniref:Uncharacterized protein n=1 Tax=Physcomitrium patens TaxID=3218 RepID=A0A7I4EDF5_PHYPA